MPTSPPPQTQDPRVTRSKALIVEAATACFIERGYDDTSVEDVAARAGIAKRTIYNIYGDKQSLFRAAIAVTIGIAERFTQARLADVGALDDLDPGLTDVAVSLAGDVLLGHVVGLRRLLSREASRFPDIAVDYRDRAPEAVLRSLAAGFGELGRRRLLDLDDPELAAEHFAFLVLGAELDRRMFGDDRTSRAHIERRAAAGAAAFIRAYRPAT